MTFAEKFDEIMTARNLSDRELARACGVSPTTVGRWREPGANPRLDEIQAVAKHLGVPVGWLADDAEGKLREKSLAEKQLEMMVEVYGHEPLLGVLNAQIKKWMAESRPPQARPPAEPPMIRYEDLPEPLPRYTTEDFSDTDRGLAAEDPGKHITPKPLVPPPAAPSNPPPSKKKLG